MRKTISVLLVIALIGGALIAWADEYRLLGVEDLEFAGGGTGAAETNTSAGGVVSTQIDATHIKMRSRAVSVESALSDNVAITGGTIAGATITLADNSVTFGKLNATSGTASANTWFSGAGTWTAPTLSQIGNLTANKAFNMSTNQLKFTFVNPSEADGAFEIEATGSYTGDLLHVHQHTGNPGASDLVHLESDDTDVVTLRIITGGATAITVNKAIVSTLATGTAPFTVASTTEVANLRAATASALAANPSDCGAGEFANAIAANGNLTCSTPAGSGTVTGPASVTQDNVVTWGADNTAIKDGGVALSALARLASPTFTGTVTIPTPFTLGAVSVLPTGTELNFVDGVTSAIQDQLDDKAPLVSPSFTTPTLGVATATTLDTGQGANELYDMNQNVQTTDNVTFASVTADQFISTCDPDDNNCYVEAVNVGELAAASQSAGRFWFDNTLNMFRARNNDNSATVQVFTSGASHTLNFATSGTLTGGIMILDNVVSPTAAQCYGAYNNITTAGTVTLPAVAAGMSHCVGIGSAIEITLELDNADTFILNGVTMDAGEAIINTTGEAAGDYICVVGLNSTAWKVLGKQGTWTQATP